jgi:hypothetical protein
MLLLTSKVQINELIFFFVSEIEIDSSWKNFTSTCKITLPRNLIWRDKNLRNELKKGDEVRVWLGYNFKYNLEFQGFVSYVGDGIPLVIECEDSMFLLKQTEVTKSFKNIALSQLLQKILPPSIKFEAVGFMIGKITINQLSVAKVLEHIKERYGLVSYFRGDKLIVGFPYTQPSRSINLAHRKNIIDANLRYEDATQTKIKLKAVWIKPNGKQVKITLGDKNGEIRTLHFMSEIHSVKELEKVALEKMKLLRWVGYRGSLKTFGAPFAEHGDIVRISDTDYQERNGDYLVDGTRVSFGVKGFRRTLIIGPKTKIKNDDIASYSPTFTEG